jgi:hypothetical protein
MTIILVVRKLRALPWRSLGLTLLLFGAFLSCVAPGVGFGVYDDGYDGAYFEPGGYEYGGWGGGWGGRGGYRVGPGRGGERGQDRSGHAYRSAAPGRRTPSVPSRSRGHR